MTVAQLISELECMDEDAEVRLAHQPSYPFEYRVGEVVDMGDFDPREMYEIMRDDDGWYIESGEEGQVAGPFETDADAEQELDSMLVKHDEEQGKFVYIGEAGQIGYLPGDVSKALGWRS
jgi:hypothetical protein